MGFIFTKDNLIDNLDKMGGWSLYGLASSALQYYFPEEYDNDGICDTWREVELAEKIGCQHWGDVIEKYHKEVGYSDVVLSNRYCVNES